VALSFAGWDLLQAVGHLQTMGYGRWYHCQATTESTQIGKPKPNQPRSPSPSRINRFRAKTENPKDHAGKPKPPPNNHHHAGNRKPQNFSCFTTFKPKKISEEREILVRQKPQKNFRGERNFRAAENPKNFQTESLFVLEENPKEQTAKERAERRRERKNFGRNERREKFSDKNQLVVRSGQTKKIDILMFTKCTVCCVFLYK
jgi:hypothetical protein